jgi:hypothetical protein
MKTQKAKAKSVKRKSTTQAASARVARLEREVQALKKHYQQLCDSLTFTVPINSLAPEPFVLKRPFHVVVRPSDGEFIATLIDANLGMTGDTADEAVEGLKMTIVDAFDFYEKNESIIGPEPTRQLAVLRELIERRS